MTHCAMSKRSYHGATSRSVCGIDMKSKTLINMHHSLNHLAKLIITMNTIHQRQSGTCHLDTGSYWMSHTWVRKEMFI